MNYFELFQMPLSVSLETKHLDEKYLELQREHHPDLQNVNSSIGSAEKAFDINLGYRILKNDIERVEYVLFLMSINLDDYRKKIPLEFLDEIVQSTDYITSEEDRTNLIDIIENKKNELQTLFKNICELFSQKKIDDMIIEFTKYKYINNLLFLAKARLDSIVINSKNDKHERVFNDRNKG